MIDKIIYDSESLKTHSTPKSQKNLSSKFFALDLNFYFCKCEKYN